MMRPTITEQLDGIRRVLAEVVAPHVADPYPADVLNGVLAALDTLSRWAEVPMFVRWDAEEASTILAMIGIVVGEPPEDQLDLDALDAHHRVQRGALEAAMPAIIADAAARSAMVGYFRERRARFPLASTSIGRAVREEGGSVAHTAR
jgi:hypothetical protein